MNLPPKTTKKNIFTRILLKCYSKVLNILHWVAHPMNLFQNILYNIMNMSYGYVLFLFTLQFYLFILFFCLLIYLIGLYDKKCIQAGSGSMDDLTTSGQMFSVLFTLSWTTFSTVGYGNTWPTLTGNPDNEQHCPAMNVLLLVEAFVGVCFAGACGAILFSKVVQVQNQAKVEFSQPITVRFGSGLSDGDEEDEDNDEEDVTPEQGLDCPILEFRFLNQLHSIEDGVITNASVTAAAGIQLNVDETDKANEEIENTKSSIRASLRTKKEKKKDMVNRVRVAKKFFLDVKFINGDHPNFKRIW